MPDDQPTRSRFARVAAERALVRIIHHYGDRPEFVVLGGLVPELLCAGSEFQHAGTTDVDVQIDLEIAYGAVNAARLEQAPRNAEFIPEDGRGWRWVVDAPFARTVVRFELLTDLKDQQEGVTVSFDECENLGAVNLRGTGFVARDFEVHDLTSRIGGVNRNAKVNVAGLAGFLFAKVAAAYSRRTSKDWYDIAFVLLHNDAGGPVAVARMARKRFADEVPDAQGSRSYAAQMRIDHPEQNP